MRIAKELSNLIIYCRSVPFCVERITSGRVHFYEMSSFPETKVEKWTSRQNCKLFLKYHNLQFSRVYPKGQRIDSSNYDPARLWSVGCQMVALNYQTPDKPMQLNQSKFMQNGNCGYVLRPPFMFREDHDPYSSETVFGVEPISISIRIIAARHLTKSGRGIVSPFVEVEVVGAEPDTGNKYKTQTKVDNGFNPVWNEECQFDVLNAELAMLRFVVQDEDMFGDPNFLGQATFPVKCIRTGYRSVPLKNGYSEELELASLLVHIAVENATERRKIMSSLRKLRAQIEDMERAGNGLAAESLRVNVAKMEEQLLLRNEHKRMIIQARQNPQDGNHTADGNIAPTR